MNLLITEDINWDNFAIVSKYISNNYLSEDVNINHVYGKKLQFISNICNKQMFRMLRRSINIENPCESIYDIIKNMDICIVFHNFIEYDTLSSFVIDTCNENNKPCIIISEHTKGYYFNGEICDIKFKNIIKNINTGDRVKEFIRLDRQFNPQELSFQPKSVSDMIIKLRHNYEQVESRRKNKEMSLINPFIGNCSNNKQIAYIDYMRDKKKWLKEVIPRS